MQNKLKELLNNNLVQLFIFFIFALWLVTYIESC